MRMIRVVIAGVFLTMLGSCGYYSCPTYTQENNTDNEALASDSHKPEHISQ